MFDVGFRSLNCCYRGCAGSTLSQSCNQRFFYSDPLTPTRSENSFSLAGKLRTLLLLNILQPWLEVCAFQNIRNSLSTGFMGGQKNRNTLETTLEFLIFTKKKHLQLWPFNFPLLYFFFNKAADFHYHSRASVIDLCPLCESSAQGDSEYSKIKR